MLNILLMLVIKLISLIHLILILKMLKMKDNSLYPGTEKFHCLETTSTGQCILEWVFQIQNSMDYG